MEVLYLYYFLTVLLVEYTIQANAKKHTTPHITPRESEYILEPYENFSLKCEGDEPIIWKPPNNSLNDNETTKVSRITIDSSQLMYSEYRYKSILTIYNASYLDIGYYYCLSTSAQKEDLSTTANIYVYVNDPGHLSILPEGGDIVVVPEYSKNVILPCRPTSPEVQVTLTQSSFEIPMNTPDLEGKIVKFDRQKGFIINQVYSIERIFYSCIFTREDSEDSEEFDIILDIQRLTDSIAKPFLEEISGGHTVVGERLVLKCTIKMEMSMQIHMEWIVPDEDGIKNGRIDEGITTIAPDGTYYQLLTINRTKIDDQGKYVCVAKNYWIQNNDTKVVRIYEKGEHFINLTEENGLDGISVQAGMPSIDFRVNVTAHPVPKLTWYNHKGEEISEKYTPAKYEVYTQDSYVTTLIINNVTIQDRGVYKLKAINNFEEKVLKLALNVTDKPTVEIQLNKFYNMVNKPSVVTCLAAAYPLPDIHWFYKNCQDDSCEFQPKSPFKTEIGILSKSYLTITANQSGYVMCTANNSLGTDKSMAGFFVTDVNKSNGFGIWGLDSDTIEKTNGTSQFPIAVKETITLYCAASRYNYTNQLVWYKNIGPAKTPLENNDHYTIEKSNTKFSNRITLIIHNADYEDSGNYTCQVEEICNTTSMSTSAQFHFDNISIIVKNPEMPVITDTNMNETEYSMNFPDKLQLWCYAKGIPKPTITWYKDDMEMATIQGRITLQENDKKLVIERTKPEDEGYYTCKVSNKMGTVEKKMKILFQNSPTTMYSYLIAVLVMLFIFVPSFVYLLLRFRKERELRRELKRAGLANFENGALESFNPELGIDDQAELLPYDKKWEFPRDKLKLGKQLGCGAFGVVVKAKAVGITEDEEVTTVAVKMVKRNADYTLIKALASELKIMVHLGKHLNVVNLLGACTKHVVKRELFVIVEYCRYGNLHNYLLRHRDTFIDQIDPKTGQMDCTLGAEILERSFSVSSTSNSEGVFKYTGETTAVSMTPSGGGITHYTCMTPLIIERFKGEDALITSNNSIQPEWRSNYRGDYKGNVKPICTKDLISWAFQVARGMEYLVTRRVLHGDLAARNILLAENDVVKICDFGLAKSMYKNDSYKKKGDGPLPVKWMAVESIRDRVFSTQSDVWSYGIVLWEFFSLARTPYPGMEADERLYNKLVDGYRMDSPEYATNEIYKIMCECWHPKPLNRPSFTSLAESIGHMLEESMRQYYIDLNDPYLIMNTQRLENGQNDYLAMLSPPDFEHLSSPHHYVNGDVVLPESPSPLGTPGYLCMNSSRISSPLLDVQNVFNFNVDTKNGKNINTDKEMASATELLPILQKQCETDCNATTLQHSPTTSRSFSNLTYQMPLSVNVKPNADVIASTDNYVNMPESKSALNSVEPHAKLHDYVNSNSRDWERGKV